MTPEEKLSEMFKKLNTTNEPINLGDLLELQEALEYANLCSQLTPNTH